MANILVVEDEPNLAMALEDDLRLEGYEVEVARDGETAGQRAQAHPFGHVVAPQFQGLAKHGDVQASPQQVGRR